MIIHGDSLEVLKTLDSDSIDAVITDPPYGLAFMGKKWDYDVPSVELWQECLRVLKPGGHLLAFAGTRTQHRMAVRIEDAGFEIRDMIAWVYGSGFPKSLDVSKAIDKAAGAEREVVGLKNNKGRAPGSIACVGLNTAPSGDPITAPATEAAKQWQGWGTALKPALEPITVARKPLVGTVADNVMEHGTGALNIDGCRVAIDPESDATQLRTMNRAAKTEINGWGMNQNKSDTPTVIRSDGRWPANFIHDGSDEVVGLFPNTISGKMGPWNNRHTDGSPNGIYGKFDVEHPISETYGDSGSAARFFYSAKSSKSERGKDNNHPTVKPIALMQYLVRLVTPPNGTVLDPFGGSGTTAVACIKENKKFVIIEREAEYVEIIKQRIGYGDLFNPIT